MALIETYAGLVVALVEASEDESTEFSDYIPTAVDLAETRLIEEVFLEGTALELDLPVNQSDNKVPKPNLYRATRTLSVISGTTTTRLLRRPRSFINEYAPDSSVEDTPKYYGDYDKDSFIVAPTPDANLTYRLHYIGRPPKLSDAVQTNFFMDSCADVLFYASMVELSIFSKDTEMQTVFEGRFQTAIQGLAQQAKRETGDDDQQFAVGIDTSVNQ